ncbi:MULTISPECIES: YneF family protein [Beduini]|uniref:YneF family protein n=1 Tax=Beduini TaxID=1922299 RepID=UPI00059A907F|nr:YneF family protein [Beduini massiliensis]
MSDLFIQILCVVVGLIVGFFGARYYFKKQLQKNPPINEKMIRAMFMEMGRKPTEAQIKRIMKSMNSQYK